MTHVADQTQRSRLRERMSVALSSIGAPAEPHGLTQARLASVTVNHFPCRDHSGDDIDWESEVLRPTALLLDVMGAQRAPVTLMAELDAYVRLAERDADMAQAVADQWRDAVARGHDVQLSVGPGPVEIAGLIDTYAKRLEDEIREAKPDYGVVAFRAGAHRVQPFVQLYDALAGAGILCDTSVCHGRHSPGADFRLAYSQHQPYFASRSDPQLKAPPAERAIVELPIFAFSADAPWALDGREGGSLDDRLLELLENRAREPRFALVRTRRTLRLIATAVYLRAPRRGANRVVPQRAAWRLLTYQPERLVASEYFVLAGSAAKAVDVSSIGDAIRRLQSQAGIRFITLSELSATARSELAITDRGTELDEHERQISQNYANVMGTKRNDLQSLSLQALVPTEARHVLDLGCGTGDWSRRIADDRPGCEVVGVDIGRDFIERANQKFGDDRVSFRVEDFAQLSFADSTFDCVYADNSLEHAYDVDQSLREVRRVLAPGGVLVAASPSDARNPSHANDSHTWKTAPHDARERLQNAGFTDIEIVEKDGYRQFEMAPYPPSRDLIMFIRAT